MSLREIAAPYGIGRHTHAQWGSAPAEDMVTWRSIAAGLMVLNRPGSQPPDARCTAKEVPSCNNAA